MEEDTAFWGRQLAGHTGSYCPLPTTGPPDGPNPCEGKKPDLPNVECIVDQVAMTGEQTGVNVTEGYQGDFETTATPITEPYWKVGLCPVNVHWHIGAEHYSLGEYDETGTGPEFDPALDGIDDIEERRRLASPMRLGYQCKHYDENDPKFTTPYDWQYCVNMTVGQTYEVHWPHSAAGACGTPNQYQTPFYDGVFCVDGVLTDTAGQIGVQSQVYTVVNDESYYWPDLMRGMIVDGDMGQDIAKYTGSTTGTTRNNTICSQFAPITWQVDRKCHLMSASSFDKMCADMLAQRDDMSLDLHPHGSRELVSDELAANNQQRRRG
jgi:Delta carbonic anhydrase